MFNLWLITSCKNLAFVTDYASGLALLSLTLHDEYASFGAAEGSLFRRFGIAEHLASEMPAPRELVAHGSRLAITKRLAGWLPLVRCSVWVRIATLPAENRQAPKERRRRTRPENAPGPTLVGYVRAKAGDADDLSGQRQSLQDAGCREIVEEVSSASRLGQPELHRLLGRLNRGDLLVVARVGSLGPSLQDVVRRLSRIEAAGLGFRSLGDAIDTTLPAGRPAAAVIAGLATLDRDVTRSRICVGLAAARAEGRVGGRPSKLNARQQRNVLQEVLSGRQSAAHMAQQHKVSEATISRLLAAHRVGAVLDEAGQPEDEGAGQGGRIVGVLPVSALDGRFAIVGISGSGN